MTNHVFEDAEGQFIELPCIPEEELAQQIGKILDGHGALLQVETIFSTDDAALLDENKGDAS